MVSARTALWPMFVRPAPTLAQVLAETRRQQTAAYVDLLLDLIRRATGAEQVSLMNRVERVFEAMGSGK
jgi:thioredoxin-like negative regulator of GroEL